MSEITPSDIVNMLKEMMLKWRDKPINSDDLKSIYRDVENIIERAGEYKDGRENC